MPYQPSRRKNTDLQRQSHAEAMKTIFRALPLYEMTDCLPAEPDYDISEYPDLLLFLRLMCGCVTASQKSAQATLDTPDVWPKVLEIYNQNAGTHLSLPRPPSLKVLDLWVRNRVANNPELMERIRTALREIASAVALEIGYLRADTAPDFTRISALNTIAGDGSYTDPASTVKIVYDDKGVRHTHGSRAQKPSRVRMQNRTTDPNKEKPNARGINNVIISVPTTAGSLWLNVDQALGAETTTAMTLLDEVVEHHPRGTHALVYDKAISWWLVEDIMARGVLVVGKSVVRTGGTRNGDDDYDNHTKLKLISADEARRRYWFDPVEGPAAAHDGPLTFEQRLPLGISVYPTVALNDNDDLVVRLHPHDAQALQEKAEKRAAEKAQKDAKKPAPTAADDPNKTARKGAEERKKELEQVWEGLVVEDTRVYPVNPDNLRDHAAPGCCDHTWWLDGDALVACDEGPDGYRYKVGLAFCTSCRTQKDQRTGQHVWFMEWTVTCPNGTHTFRTVTRPTKVPRDERKSWNRNRKRGAELAWDTLRPLARAHGKPWSDVANRRNVAESTNAWLARCFTILGVSRARRLRANEQRLDLFSAWAFRIADVYRVALLQGLFDADVAA